MSDVVHLLHLQYFHEQGKNNIQRPGTALTVAGELETPPVTLIPPLLATRSDATFWASSKSQGPRSSLGFSDVPVSFVFVVRQ